MLFHVQMQMTISSLDRAGLCSHLNRGQGFWKNIWPSCHNELCCPETFLEFKEWSVLPRRYREQGKSHVPRASPQLFLYPIPLPTPENQYSWSLNWFSCLHEFLLQSMPIYTTRVIQSFIHSDITYLIEPNTLYIHVYDTAGPTQGREQGSWRRRNMSLGSLYSMILLMCSSHITPLCSNILNGSLWPTE